MDRTVARGFLIPAVLVIAGCAEAGDAPGAGGETRGGGGTVVACLEQLPENLNPFVSADQGSAELAPLVFTTLVEYAEPDSDRDFVPALARSWEWEEEGRVVRFRIRGGLTWHDGRPVTSEDVAWTLSAAADSAFGYWNWPDFSTLEGVSRVGEDEVEVRFSAPYGADLEPFATLPILPRHLLAEVAADTFGRAAYHRAPIGSGPYILRGRLRLTQLVYERNPAFPADLGAPTVERIVVKEIPEVTTQLVELRTGESDLCLTGSRAAQQARGIESLRVIPASPGLNQVIFLDHRSKYLDTPEERRAISAAIDRDAIARLVSPLASSARSFLPVGWSTPDTLLQADAAAALADSLLEAAGWSRDGGGTRRDGTGAPLAFPILAPQGYQDVLTVLQDQLARVGVAAEPRVMEGSAFIDLILDPDRRPPAMLIGLAPSRLKVPTPRSSLHTDGGTNLATYSNAAVDTLLDRLATAAAASTRASIYQALQAHVVHDVPLIYLAHTPSVVIAGPSVDGVRAGPAGLFASAPEWRKR